MIDGQNFFDQPIRNNSLTYDSIQKTATGQGDDHTTGSQLYYIYFKKHCKMMAIDLSKNKHLMLIQNKYSKLNLLEIQKNNQQYFSLLKKLKKKFQIFHKEL